MELEAQASDYGAGHLEQFGLAAKAAARPAHVSRAILFASRSPRSWQPVLCSGTKNLPVASEAMTVPYTNLQTRPTLRVDIVGHYNCPTSSENKAISLQVSDVNVAHFMS
jgi:hypothetical protein